MIEKQLKLYLKATVAVLALLQSASAYMSPMSMMNPMMSPSMGPSMNPMMGPGMSPAMNPMMGPPMGGMLNPMDPYGYHVARRRRHRSLFQRLTGTGRRYNYYIRPNSYMSGSMPMGMGLTGSPMGMGTSVTSISVSGGVPSMGGMGMSSSMFGKDYSNTVRSASALTHACRSNDTNTLRHVSCPYMSQHDLHYCYTRASDSFLAALVRKCKGVFTGNPYQMTAYGVELILANKTMPFGEILTHNTCLMLGSYEMKTLLKTAILSRTTNSFAFVDHILNTCDVPVYLMARLQTLALMHGDMSVAMRLQRASMYPVNHHYPQNIIYVPSGLMIQLTHDSALSQLNGRDMAVFGKIGRVCALLRPEHLTHPLFNAELLSEMNENCFRHLKPRLFWYMTSDMIKRFRYWRSATPQQLYMVPIGRPIQAVPFYLLGQHPYINKLDRSHPCAGITKTQRISIQMEPKTARAFYERCRASNAMAIKASATLLISALFAYFAFAS